MSLTNQTGTLAIDGCKISSNASKEWSGTISELETKKENKRKINEIMEEHKNSDPDENNFKRIDKLDKKMEKITDFLCK
ncbi:MAG: hypothetical protein HS129_05825 [Leptospiraceae bacterium]|nr:hypothetical protein [Leptospiraceae bacterium]